MILPTLSINGTHKNELWLAAAEVKLKVETALDALRKTSPHPRDYQYAPPGQGRDFDTALDEYSERINKLKSIIADMEALMEHTD